MKTVLGIGGSPRKGGNSDILLRQLLAGARRGGADSEEIQLRDYQFQPCIACERCRKDGECTGLQDGMQLIYPKIRAAHGLILVTPIHSYNMTALMKSFIDRLYSFYRFGDARPGDWGSQLAGQGRKSIIVAVGEQAGYDDSGMGLTLETMRRSMEALGYEVIDELPVLGVFPKGKVKHYPETLSRAKTFGGRLAAALS